MSFWYIFSILIFAYTIIIYLTTTTEDKEPTMTNTTYNNNESISSLYKAWRENPEDVIEPTTAKEVFILVPSLLPFVDPYIDDCNSEYKGKEYCGRGFHITDYSNFMKAFNELPERPKGKFWIVRMKETGNWMLQIRGIV